MFLRASLGTICFLAFHLVEAMVPSWHSAPSSTPEPVRLVEGHVPQCWYRPFCHAVPLEGLLHLPAPEWSESFKVWWLAVLILFAAFVCSWVSGIRMWVSLLVTPGSFWFGQAVQISLQVCFIWRKCAACVLSTTVLPWAFSNLGKPCAKAAEACVLLLAALFVVRPLGQRISWSEHYAA